jgi:hypothetical protein
VSSIQTEWQFGNMFIYPNATDNCVWPVSSVEVILTLVLGHVNEFRMRSPVAAHTRHPISLAWHLTTITDSS